MSRMSRETKLVVASCMLTAADLATLDGQSWLNDAVIHAYLALVARSYDSYVLPSFLGVRWQATPVITHDWLFTRVLSFLLEKYVSERREKGARRRVAPCTY